MNVLLTLVVIVAALGFAGTHQNGMDAGTSVPPSSGVVHSDVTRSNDGCDHVNIQQGDHPYTQAEIDRMTRMATEFCQRLTKATDDINSGAVQLPEPS